MELDKAVGRNEKKTAADRVGSFLIKYRLIFMGIVGVLLVTAVVFSVFIALDHKAAADGVSRIEEIVHTLSQAEEAGYAAAREKAAASLQPFAGKKSVVGVRANMVLADLYYAENNWQAACDAWLAAASADKKAYTAPLAWFNAAVCYEELGNTDEAIAYYRKAADTEDFALASHALFSIGRIKDAAGDYAGAGSVYQELTDSYPSDAWAALAKSRLIALKAEGAVIQP